MNISDQIESTDSESIETLSEELNLKNAKIKEIEDGIDCGIYEHIKKEAGSDGRKLRSKCWDLFHIIVENGNIDNIVPNHVYCTGCKKVLENRYAGGNTNEMNRHKCANRQIISKPITIKEKGELRSSAAKYVAIDLQSYKSVGNDGMREYSLDLMQFGQKHPTATREEFKEALATRKTVKEAVKKLSDDNSKLIKNEMKKAKKFNAIAVIIDGWTSENNQDSYLGVIGMLSYTDESGHIVRQKFTLKVDELDEPVKTKEVIIKHLYAALASYGLSEDEIRQNVVVVSDRGANIKFAIQDAKIEQIFCFAHIINNIVDAMAKDDELKTTIKCASQLASYLKITGLCKSFTSTVKNFVSTRWNSIFIMFDSILKNYENILGALTEKENAQKSQRARTRVPEANNSQAGTSAACAKKSPLDYVLCVDIETVHFMAKFLKPFKDMTTNLEGHLKPNLHMVWPAFCKINELLQPNDFGYDNDKEEEMIERIKRNGRSYMQAHLNDFSPRPAHKIATVLHPFMKSLPKFTNIEKDEAYMHVDKVVRCIPLENVQQLQKKQTERSFNGIPFLNDFCKTEGKNCKKKYVYFF